MVGLAARMRARASASAILPPEFNAMVLACWMARSRDEFPTGAPKEKFPLVGFSAEAADRRLASQWRTWSTELPAARYLGIRRGYPAITQRSEISRAAELALVDFFLGAGSTGSSSSSSSSSSLAAATAFLPLPGWTAGEPLDSPFFL